MGVSEIRVKRIRVNQGLGVYENYNTIEFKSCIPKFTVCIMWFHV